VNWACELIVWVSSAGQIGADSFAFSPFFIDFVTSLFVYDTASRVADCHIGAIHTVTSVAATGGGTLMLSAAFQSRLVLGGRRIASRPPHPGLALPHW
jgi:hypothetical protein